MRISVKTLVQAGLVLLCPLAVRADDPPSDRTPASGVSAYGDPGPNAQTTTARTAQPAARPATGPTIAGRKAYGTTADAPPSSRGFTRGKTPSPASSPSGAVAPRSPKVVAPRPSLGASAPLTTGPRVVLVPSENSRRLANSGRVDGGVQKVQIVGPGPNASEMTGGNMAGPLSGISGGDADSRSFSLQAALYGSLRSNPDLVTLRQGALPNTPSAEAVEVARRFPTTLNPTLWIDYRPVTLIPRDTFANNLQKGGKGPFYHNGGGLFYFSYRQPLELGHQTTHRYEIAKAAFQQQRWNVVQAELLALVQTFRFFQTAAYRREKLKAAQELADFNDRILETLNRRLEANQVLPADVILAKVETRSSRQLVKAAQQDYATALTDLRNQIGIPETAGVAEPLGEFVLPGYIPTVDDQQMIQVALCSRPDIMAARAAVKGSLASVRLEKGNRIPSPVVGPQYEIDEAGVQYIGFVLIIPFPVVNNGSANVALRQAESRRAAIALQQVQQKAVSQVRSAVAKWNGAIELVNDTDGLTDELAKEVESMERLFEAGQTDLAKLTQARQRLIQLKNARLDAVWQATIAQADLLIALGAPNLINAMLNKADKADAPAAPGASNPPANGPRSASAPPPLNVGLPKPDAPAPALPPAAPASSPAN